MENIKNTIQQNFAEAQNALEQFSTPENFEKIAQAAQLMADSMQNIGKIISC
ncbi:MAG TPA: phosphoheptose isomerase, partial [Flavobacteriales bacterium]|nr:phosphoheptose isomerase [Flavobacteriales bacterium]